MSDPAPTPPPQARGATLPSVLLNPGKYVWFTRAEGVYVYHFTNTWKGRPDKDSQWRDGDTIHKIGVAEVRKITADRVLLRKRKASDWTMQTGKYTAQFFTDADRWPTIMRGVIEVYNEYVVPATGGRPLSDRAGVLEAAESQAQEHGAETELERLKQELGQ